MSKDLPKGKPVLCLDFDGVIHGYDSGWKGPRCIPDEPVPGALEAIVGYVQAGFDVQIFSSRSRYWFARWAMKQWLKRHYHAMGASGSTTKGYASIPDNFRHWIAEMAFADPWDYELDYAIRRLLRRIKFPTEKPPAMVTIDDRGFRFEGVFPSPESLREMRPWNKV